MVGAINPNSSTSITTQQDLARNSAYMLNPGEPFPPEAPLPSNLPSSTAVPLAPVAQKHGLSAGAIAGIVVAAVFVVSLCGGLFFCWGRTRTIKDEVERKESSVARRVSRGNIVSHNMSGRGETTQPSGLGIYDSQQYLVSHQAQVLSPGQEMGQYSLGAVFPHHQHQYSQPHFPQDHKPLPSSPPFHTHPAFSSPTHPTAYELSPHSPTPNPNPYFTSPTTHTFPQVAATNGRDDKYGPYGLQQRQSTGTPAPPYGWHVNQVGPVEMEGTGVRDEGEGRDGGSARERERGRVKGRWEEVGLGEGGMF